MSKTATKRARRRTPKAPKYTRHAKPSRLGSDMHLVLVRGRRKLPRVGLDEVVEHVNWEREGADRTGEVTFHRPVAHHGADLVLAGDYIELYVAPLFSQRWQRVWRLRVATPRHQIDEGTITIALDARLANWDKQRVAWKVRKGRLAHQVTQIAARRFHIPLGRVAKAKHRLPKHVVKKASAKTIVEWAWTQEREHTGRRFNVSTAGGVLEVLELRYPKYARELGDAILSAEIDHSTGGLATVLVAVSSHRPKGQRKAHKLRVRVVDRRRLRRYGTIERTVHHNASTTRADLRRWAKAHLARMKRPVKEVTFTHPGIPFLDRGDAVKVELDEDGTTLVGFVKAVRHDASAGSYTTEITAGIDDPYVDKKKAKTRAKRDAAARKRARKEIASQAAAKRKKGKAARRS